MSDIQKRAQHQYKSTWLQREISSTSLVTFIHLQVLLLTIIAFYLSIFLGEKKNI